MAARSDGTRGSLKGHKLEYLYQINVETAIDPLLGACVRALGKEWNIHLLSSKMHWPLFVSFRELLKHPELLSLSDIESAYTPQRENHLVVIDGIYNPDLVYPLREQILGKSHVIAAGADPFEEDYDLISRFTQTTLHEQGVTAFVGSGKGKSSSAFGIAGAAAARGGKAAIVQWFKEPKGPKGTWSINEHYFPEQLRDPSALAFYPTGSGFYSIANLDRLKGLDAYAEHRKKAMQGCELATQLITSGQYAVVVLDEFVDTLAEVARNIPQSLLDLSMAQELLSLAVTHPETEVVVTGRRITAEWSDFIKQSHVIDEIRHPWSHKGKAALSGLDF